MGDANLHARKVLLRRYEAVTIALERPINYKQCYFLAGKLRALAEVLQECRHTGDTPALKGEAWIADADQRIANALLVLEQKGELLQEQPKAAPAPVSPVSPPPQDPFKVMRETSEKMFDFATKGNL